MASHGELLVCREHSAGPEVARTPENSPLTIRAHVGDDSLQRLAVRDGVIDRRPANRERDHVARDGSPGKAFEAERRGSSLPSTTRTSTMVWSLGRGRANSEALCPRPGIAVRFGQAH